MWFNIAIPGKPRFSTQMLQKPGFWIRTVKMLGSRFPRYIYVYIRHFFEVLVGKWII